MDTVIIRVRPRLLPPLLACLGIGTLRSIQQGILHDDAGIWSLGATMVRLPAAIENTLPPEIVNAYRASDELEAIRRVVSEEAYHAALEDLIAQLETALAQLDNKIWRMRLAVDDADASSIRKHRYKKPGK